MKKSLLLTGFALLTTFAARAQSFDWAASMGGTGSEASRSICTDASGNVYVTGNFSGTADFDPGPGVANLTATGSSNIFVMKLDVNGALVWARAMTGNDVSRGYAIAVDGSGNVYSTGFFAGTVDFDPGSGTLNFNSGSAVWRDYYVQKLDASGNLVWAHAFGSANEDIGYDIEVDVNGDILITGTYEGTMDADPGPGVANLTMSSLGEIFVQKLDDAGNYIWAKAMMTSNPLNGGDDNGYAMASDAAGNVIVGGMFGGEVDFDPGTGTAVLSNTNFDGFVVKLDVNGNFVWVRQLGGTGNISVNSVLVTAGGEVVAAGNFSGELDGDTGAGANLINSAGDQDLFVVKWDATGNQQWFNHVGGVLGDYSQSLAEDASGNLFVGGFFSDTTDFDPGAGVNMVASAGGIDAFVQQLDAGGNFISLMQLGGAGNEGCFTIAFAGTSLWLAGYFDDTLDMNPFAGTDVHTSAGSTDAWVVKLGSFATETASATAQAEVLAFPNPASDRLTVSSSERIEIVRLVDVSGRVCMQADGLGEKEMNLSVESLASGVYLLQVQTDAGLWAGRVVRD